MTSSCPSSWTCISTTLCPAIGLDDDAVLLASEVDTHGSADVLPTSAFTSHNIHPTTSYTTVPNPFSALPPYLQPNGAKSFAQTFLSPSTAHASKRPPPDVSMIFSEFHKQQAMAHRRRAMATTPAISEYEADLTSKDRDRQKKAIREMLKGKIRNDWEWQWPPAHEDAEVSRDAGGTASVTANINSVHGEPGLDEDEDEAQGRTWMERDEWESNDSVTEDESGELGPHEDPFDAENNDSGVALDSIQLSDAEKRKQRRRKRLLKEMAENDGMRCFVHRRNAWTGAKHVTKNHGRVLVVKGKERRASTVSGSVANRFGLLSGKDIKSGPHTSFATTTTTYGTSPATLSAAQPSLPQIITPSSTHDYITNWITLIPTGPPILPPTTPMRLNITEKSYGTIYDKVVLQSQTPYCPINLATIVASCVKGWQRDGEWAPPSEAEQRRADDQGLSITKKDTRPATGGTVASETHIGNGNTGGGDAAADNHDDSKEKSGKLRRSLKKFRGIVKIAKGEGNSGPASPASFLPASEAGAAASKEDGAGEG